jgi:hypothetical protein
MADLDFLKLPWEIQVALASGYAAYALAYTGLRDRQRTIDIAFLSLVFSVPATIIFAVLASKPPTITIPLAFAAAFAVALVWRKFLRPFVFPILKKYDVTWSDDDPSALATLSGNSKFRITQIAVLLDDGTWLRCDDARKFSDAPFAPYLLGLNGDVALYLTHEEAADGKVKTLATVRDPGYGDRITYVPASHVKRITIRHVPTPNRPSKAAGEAEDHSAQKNQSPQAGSSVAQ